MKRRSIQAALKIALIREEYSDDEILEAVELLESLSSADALLDYIAKRRNTQEDEKAPTRRRKEIDEQRSQALLKLEKADPQKYQILSEFDLGLRRSDILEDTSEIKRFGEALNKDFSARNSRRDLVSKLIEVLAEKSISEIQSVIRRAMEMSQMQENEYQQLANFIISGAKSSTS